MQYKNIKRIQNIIFHLYLISVNGACENITDIQGIVREHQLWSHTITPHFQRESCLSTGDVTIDSLLVGFRFSWFEHNGDLGT